MKRNLLLFISLLFLTTIARGQTDVEFPDLLFLKNGEILRCSITQFSNNSYWIFVNEEGEKQPRFYNYDEVKDVRYKYFAPDKKIRKANHEPVDLIVIATGDSLRCEIENKTQIGYSVYAMNAQNRLAKMEIKDSYIKMVYPGYYYESISYTEEIKELSDFDRPGFNFTTEIGYGVRLGQQPGVGKINRSSLVVGGEINFNLRNPRLMFGFLVNYRYNNSQVWGRDFKMNTWYIAPVLTGLFNVKTPMHHGFWDISLGYVNYSARYMYLKNAHNAWGAKSSYGFRRPLGDHVAFLFKLSFFLSTVNIDGETGNLSSINLTLGLSFGK